MREITGILRRHHVLKGISPEQLPPLLEDLGPAFVKFGQIISMRPDILPPAYAKELARLRADVAPLRFDEVEEILAAYGEPLRDVRQGLDRTPLGSASVAQAHITRLPDGSRAVVKVLRPGVYESMERDILLLKRMIRLLHYVPGVNGTVDIEMMLDEILAVARQETNLRQEAENAAEFLRDIQNVPYAACPRVLRAFDTVLVMEYAEGIPIDQVGKLRAAGNDPNQIALRLVDQYLRQIVEDGFFHADPHPGNLMVRDGTIIWLDFGMMGRISGRDKELILQMISAIARNDATELTDGLMEMCACGVEIDRTALSGDLEKLVHQYAAQDFAQLDMKPLLDDLLTVLKTYHIGLPKNVSMLVRGMVTIQGVIRILNPQLNLIKNLTSYLRGSAVRRFTSKAGLQKSVAALYSDLRQALETPARVSKIVEDLARGTLKINRETGVSRATMTWVERLAGRLIAGWVLGALVIGSSLMCALQTPPLVRGVSALGAAGFIVAVLIAAGLWIHLRLRKKR